jgi:hypothetical protein
MGPGAGGPGYPSIQSTDNEYDIFISPTIEEETRYDYNMPPIFDDYGDENNYLANLLLP